MNAFTLSKQTALLFHTEKSETFKYDFGFRNDHFQLDPIRRRHCFIARLDSVDISKLNPIRLSGFQNRTRFPDHREPGR